MIIIAGILVISFFSNIFSVGGSSWGLPIKFYGSNTSQSGGYVYLFNIWYLLANLLIYYFVALVISYVLSKFKESKENELKDPSIPY